MVKTKVTIAHEIYREVLQLAKHALDRNKQINILASAAVIDYLVGIEGQNFKQLQIDIKAKINLQTNTAYRHEQFDVVIA